MISFGSVRHGHVDIAMVYRRITIGYDNPRLFMVVYFFLDRSHAQLTNQITELRGVYFS